MSLQDPSVDRSLKALFNYTSPEIEKKCTNPDAKNIKSDKGMMIISGPVLELHPRNSPLCHRCQEILRTGSGSMVENLRYV